MTLPPTLRRILIAIDASPSSLAALEAASDLAMRRQAELEALFVEDVNILRLAAHPGISAFSLLSARRQTLDADALQTALKAQTARARQAVEMAAARRRIAWSFVVRRGRVEAEVLAAAESADLLIMGWSGGMAGGRLGTTARSLVERGSRPLFLLRKPVAPEHAVLAVYDGGPAGERALLLAAELARRDGGVVEVLLSDEGLAEQARAALAGSGLEVRTRVSGPDGVRTAVGRSPGCVLVLGATAGDRLADLPCAVVIAR